MNRKMDKHKVINKTFEEKLMMIQRTIKQKDLELLKKAAIKNKKGLSNFVLIQNKDRKHGDFIFRVVCEQVKGGK